MEVVWKQPYEPCRHHPVQVDLGHALIVMVTEEDLQGTATEHQKGPRVSGGLGTDLGSGPGVSQQLFNCGPLTTVLAELEEEAGYKGAKEPPTLGEHTWGEGRGGTSALPQRDAGQNEERSPHL